MSFVFWTFFPPGVLVNSTYKKSYRTQELLFLNNMEHITCTAHVPRQESLHPLTTISLPIFLYMLSITYIKCTLISKDITLFTHRFNIPFLLILLIYLNRLIQIAIHFGGISIRNTHSALSPQI